MKRALIILTSVAVGLGLITFYVVFYNGGTYVVSSSPSGNGAYSTNTGASSSTAAASSTASSTIANTSSSASTSTLAQYSSTYGSSAPIMWLEGLDRLSITGASLDGSQLTLTLSIQMGGVAECVPMNLRLVADENGDLTAPLTTQFSFPDSGTCQGTPGALYTGQQIVFNVDPTTLPLVFTTGGTSNTFFELSTTPQGGITITPPPTSG